MICVSSYFSCPDLSFRIKKMGFLWSFEALSFNGGNWECLQMKKEIPNSPHTSLYSRASRIWATARYGRATHLATQKPWSRTRVRHHHALATFMHCSSSRTTSITHAPPSRISHSHTLLTIHPRSRTRISTPSRMRMRVRHQPLRSTLSNFKLP